MIALIGIVAEPLFVSVIDLLPLTFPTATGPQLRLEGVETRLPMLAIPPPVRATLCGLLLAESEMVNVAERGPVLAVLKNIVTVHVADGGTVNPHDRPDTANSLAWGPAMDMPVSPTEFVVPLFKVTDKDLPSEPA